MSFEKSGVANRYRLTFDNADPVEVENTAADVVRWERSHNGTKFMDGTPPSTTAWLEVAFYACRRLGLTSESHFDSWFGHVVDFELDTDGDKGGASVDPTRTGQSDDSSV